MKRIILALCMAAVLGLRADEDVPLAQNAVLRGDHTLVSLKAGTIVTVISKDATSATIRYKNTVGTIALAKLAPAPASPTQQQAATPAPATSPAKPTAAPQTAYGRDVQKAKDVISKHTDAMVKPTDDSQKDPSK